MKVPTGKIAVKEESSDEIALNFFEDKVTKLIGKGS